MDGVVEHDCEIIGKKSKSQDKRKNSNTTKREREANWTDQDTNLFLDLLQEVQSRRQDPNSDGGYNDLEWSYVYTNFTKNTTQKRPLVSLKLRWKNLKCDFSFFRYMANCSGCGWNEDEHIPDVPRDAWSNLKEKDPNRYKKYVKKTFPWYKKMEILYGKSNASGRSNNSSDRPISRTLVEASSSHDDNAAPQQEIHDSSIPEIPVMADGVELVNDPVHVPISESVDPVVDARDSEPIYEDTQTTTPMHVPSSQNRKRGSNLVGEHLHCTKMKKTSNHMDGFYERFLKQQQERTELIASLSQPNRVHEPNHIHEQALNKLHLLQLPSEVHVDMELSLGNSWIRACFMKEEDNDRLMMIVDRAVRLFRSGQLPLSC